jgi:hypothetical protein
MLHLSAQCVNDTAVGVQCVRHSGVIGTAETEEKSFLKIDKKKDLFVPGD